jgi:hypothetical protein
MKILFLLAIFACVFYSMSLYSWHDQTHVAVGTAAGFKLAYNLAAPDVAKLKAKNIESYNHYCNVSESMIITSDLVRKQIDKYNSPDDSEGHLYGAIVAAVRDYQSEKKRGKYSDYNLVYVGHYIGDLSMPLHNMDYDDYNKKNHTVNDATIENEVNVNINKIIIVPITIRNEEDLINAIVQLANDSKNLAYKLEKENRYMTKEEAYSRISKSASLLKSVLEYVNFNK